jgi:DNA primase
MGSTISRYQAALLSMHFDRVVLMLDGDEAGRQGARNIAHTLGTRMSVSALSLDDGRQPDELTPRELQQLLAASAVATLDQDPATRM